MLTTADKKDIRKIVKEEVRSEVEKRTDPLRGSLVKIEADRKIWKDIWEFVKLHTKKLEDHEERLQHLESPLKF